MKRMKRMKKMKKIMQKARILLRNVYAALGAVVMPVLIHAAYGIREIDASAYTVPVQGIVVSEETGEPVAGIRLFYHIRKDTYSASASADTDSDGRFLIYVPEEDAYVFNFSDIDAFKSGGFFTSKSLSITRDETGDPLTVALYRESRTAVIRGTVRSSETGKPVSGIRISVSGYNGDKFGEVIDGSVFIDDSVFSEEGFRGLSDSDGQFYIQAPERDAYRIFFYDTTTRLFRQKQIDLTSDEIKVPLKVELYPIAREKTGKHGGK
jgi:hypothetical protein